MLTDDELTDKRYMQELVNQLQAKVSAAEAVIETGIVDFAKMVLQRDAYQQQGQRLADTLGRFVRSMTVRPDGSRYCGACGEETGEGYEHDEECFVAPLEAALAEWNLTLGQQADQQPPEAADTEIDHKD